MRAPWSLLPRLRTSATRMTRRFGDALNAPLRWPRITTRRLMVLIAMVALLLWAAEEMPRMIDQTITRQLLAEFENAREQEFRDQEREWLASAAFVVTEFDQARLGSGAHDEPTERYLASRRDFEIASARYFGEMAAYHEACKRSYRRAWWFPWLATPSLPRAPTDPFSQLPPKPEPAGVHGFITMGVSVAFSPRATTLAVGCHEHENCIRLLEPPSWREQARFPLTNGVEANCIQFSPDGQTLIASGEHHLRRWDLATGRPLPALPWSDPSPDRTGSMSYASAIDCSPDGETIAVAGSGFVGKSSTEIPVVRLLDAQTGELKWEHKGPGHSASSVAFSPNGETVAYGSGAAVLLDARTGAVTKTLKPVMGYVLDVAYAPDGRTLAGAGSNNVGTGGFGGLGRVTLWDVSTGTIRRTLEGPTGRAQKVAFSPDGRTVAAGGTGRKNHGRDKSTGARMAKTSSEVRLWDVATGSMIWTAEGESDAAFSLAFSADGRSLAYCDEDYVYLLDAKTGELKQIVMETIVGAESDARPTAARRIIP